MNWADFDRLFKNPIVASQYHPSVMQLPCAPLCSRPPLLCMSYGSTKKQVAYSWGTRANDLMGLHGWFYCLFPYPSVSLWRWHWYITKYHWLIIFLWYMSPKLYCVFYSSISSSKRKRKRNIQMQNKAKLRSWKQQLIALNASLSWAGYAIQAPQLNHSERKIYSYVACAVSHISIEFWMGWVNIITTVQRSNNICANL